MKPATFRNGAGSLEKIISSVFHGKDTENGRISQPARKTNIIVYEFRNSWQI